MAAESLAKAPDDIVVTGFDMVTPYGGLEDTWTGVTGQQKSFVNLRTGEMAGTTELLPEEKRILADIERRTTEAEIAGVIPDAALAVLENEPFASMKKEMREWARAIVLGVLVCGGALKMGGMLQTENDGSFALDKVDGRLSFPLLEGLNTERIGVAFGSGIAGAIELTEFYEPLMAGKAIMPSKTKRVLVERAATVPAMKFGLHGPLSAGVGACATGNANIIEAAKTLKLGLADAMVTGATEAEIVPVIMGAFDGMHALDRTTDPNQGSLSFDNNRRGFVPSEGAGALLLETRAHAENRGATIYGELVGYGSTSDAYHDTSPYPTGEHTARAMRLAMEMAERAGKIDYDQLGYVNTHGTATGEGDPAELRAIGLVKQLESSGIVLGSTKDHLGHMIGAAGAVESIICLLALLRREAPPTLADDLIDEAKPYTMPKAVEHFENLGWGLNNSFGFGGVNHVTAWTATEDGRMVIPSRLEK